MTNKSLKTCLTAVILFISLSSTTFTQTDFWELAGNPSNQSIYNLVFAPNGNLFAATSERVLADKFTDYFNVYKSTDYGTTWSPIDTTIGSAFKYAMTVSQISGTIIIAGADTIYRSTDEGASWMSIPCNTSIMNLSSSLNGDFFAGTPISGIVRSTDDGLTWENYYSGLTQFCIYSFAFKDSGVTFCSSVTGAVYLSTNNGESWTPILIPGCWSYVVSLTAQSNGCLFAGTSGNGVYRTSDNGDNWVNINNGLLNTYVQTLCLNLTQHIFAGTSGGVFYSFDLGNGWAEINGGLTDTDIYCLAIGPDGRICAGTSSGQVFRSIKTTTSILPHPQEQINQFSLSQNYPNPFNPNTVIRYTIPKDGRIKLNVYNSLGQKVAELVNGEIKAGTYEIYFNASNLSSGIYYYSIETEGFINAKKMILLK